MDELREDKLEFYVRKLEIFFSKLLIDILFEIETY